MHASAIQMSTAEALQRLAQARDTQAWALLVERHGAEIQRVCRRVLRDESLTEDACQETLLQLRDRAGAFAPQGANPEAAARAWILQVACHTALHLLRKHRNDRQRDDRGAKARSTEQPSTSEAHVMDRETAGALHRELAALPEAERTPILLHYYGSLGYAELAGTLRCPEGTAKARVSRGLERLRQRLALLGLVFAAGELTAALAGSEAHAAEAAVSSATSGITTLTPEHLARWNELLKSPRQPVVPAMASTQGVSTMLKLSMGVGMLLAAGLLTLAMTGTPGAEGAPPPVEKTAPARPASIKPQPRPENEDKTLAALVEGNNRFALALYGRLRSEKGNLFFSPFSINAALTQAMAGARGQTAYEIAQLLGSPVGIQLEHLAVDINQADVHPAYGELLKRLNSPEAQRSYQLKVANSMWVQKDLGLEAAFVGTLRDHYASELKLADFKQDREAALKAINAWVAEQTHNKITEVLGEDNLSPDTRLVLANAIYFKSDWRTPFNSDRTGNENFMLLNKQEIKVPTMFESFHGLSHARHEIKSRHMTPQGYACIELPYKRGELSMLVCAPFGDAAPASQLEMLEEDLVARGFHELFKGLRPASRVNVYLPKFKFEKYTNLNPLLHGLGLEAAFEPGQADFSGITRNDKLFIARISHKAIVNVDEAGTEAAAATIVEADGKDDPDEVKTFKADRPFVFAIRENKTGLILFMGRVTDPR